ncbi:MAG: hypothetical protein ACRC2K_09225, partial [Clostridium sp.]
EKNKRFIVEIAPCVYILEVMLIIKECTKNAMWYYLIYDGRCNKIIVGKFDPIYYNRKLKVKKYYIK